MKTSLDTPIQFCTNDGIGLRVANVMAIKRLRRANNRPHDALKRQSITGDVFADVVALGTHALVQHIRQLIHDDGMRIIIEHPQRTRIRVCGALDYVVDRSLRRVWAEAAPLTFRESRSKLIPPWDDPTQGMMQERIDLLNPLCKPLWLGYVAARPGWFGYAIARHQLGQDQLFVEQDDMALAFESVIQLASRQIRTDKALVALRHQLSSTLTFHIGPGVVSLAMRARPRTLDVNILARHLSLVWRNQHEFDCVARENPQLLPALTVWLLHNAANDPAQYCDPVQQMRRDVLASGLPPKAWRYLLRHGIKKLTPSSANDLTWSLMIKILKALACARWPELPPRGFLRLMNDVAGVPDSFESSTEGVPGWFWQFVCDEASALRGDTQKYAELFDSVPKWAWLTREFALRPDKNQRRRGIGWLRDMANRLEDQGPVEEGPIWHLWLPSDGWAAKGRARIVPILSPSSLFQEALAMHNCIDTYEDRCQSETHIILSIRDLNSGKRLANMCIASRGDTWYLGQIAGPCNSAVAGWIRRAAQEAVEAVRIFDGQRIGVQLSLDTSAMHKEA